MIFFLILFICIISSQIKIATFLSACGVLYFFIRNTLQEKILFLSLFGIPFLGFFLSFIGGRGIASYTIIPLLGLYLLWAFYHKKIHLNIIFLGFEITALIVIFIIWYFLGPKTEMCPHKLKGILWTLIIGTVQCILLLRQDNIIPKKIAQSFTAVSVCLCMSVLWLKYNVTQIDIAIMRELFHMNRESGFNYQVLTIYCGLSVAFCCMANKNWGWKVSLLLNSVAIALISGGRQVLLITFASIITCLIINKIQNMQKNKIKSVVNVILIATICLLSIWYFLTNYIAEYEVWSKVLSADSFSSLVNRNDDTWKITWQTFSAHPIVGGGLGSFKFTHNDLAGVEYPHNYFLEVIAEMGVLGLFLLSIPFFILLKKYSWYNLIFIRSQSNFFILPLFLTYFLRAMVSDSLAFSSNILVFICVLAASTYVKYERKLQDIDISK